MATTTFVDEVTVIEADWLNDVDAAVYQGTFAGDVTGDVFMPTSSTGAGDIAAVGYSSANGLMLTGQGSTYDVAILNDLAQVAMGVPTGTVNVTFTGQRVDLDNATNPKYAVTDTTNGVEAKLQALNTQSVIGSHSNHNAVFVTNDTIALTLDTSQNSTFAGTITGPAATTSLPTLNIPHGTAPSSPTNGDMWTTTAGLFVRINGSTVGPLA